MATEFNTGSDASLDEAVKSRYEANPDTNAFTDGEKSKLAGVSTGAQPNTVDSVNGATGAVVLTADDINDSASAQKFATAAQLTKVDGIETGATADQSGAEIVSAIDAELGGSSWQSGGGSGGSGPVDVVSNVAQDRILGRVSSGSGNSEELTATQARSFLNVADGATANSGALANLDAVDTAQIADDAVTNAKIANDAIGTAQIADGAVFFANIADIPTGRLVGRTASGSGILEVLTPADVMGLLALNSTSAGEGASQVGLADTGDLFTATDVETALQELATILDGYGTAVTLDQTDVVLQGGQDVIIFDAGGDSNAVRPSQPATKTVIWFNHGQSLPTNMGTFDIANGGGFGVAPVKTESGAAYALGLGDAGFNIDMDAASANTVTVPAEASVSFAIGSCLSITQLGAGSTSITADAGVTLNGVAGGSVSINNQFSGVVLRKTGSDAWVAQGDIS